ncbi:MAG: hypothetical protein UC758_09235 [Ruminococcus bromii]|nr:hypothetical protein [Ruminococcus bromii]MEE0609770.1 hypothetical protein [Ruminococcus bromii]
MKSRIVVSSSLIDKKPKQRVTARGTIILVCASISIDNKSAMPIIAKSRKLHSHRLAVAFRFCGYK